MLSLAIQSLTLRLNSTMVAITKLTPVEMAFKIAGSMGFQEGVQESRTQYCLNQS